MAEAPSPEEKKQPNAGEELADKMKDAYRWWDNLASLNENDPLWLGGIKIIIRIVGILILLAISPFALLAIIVAFLAVA